MDPKYMSFDTQALEHLRVIRKYLAWITFIMVLTFALSVLGFVVSATGLLDDSGTSNDELCVDIPALCE
jgi:hypothetical protein